MDIIIDKKYVEEQSKFRRKKASYKKRLELEVQKSNLSNESLKLAPMKREFSYSDNLLDCLTVRRTPRSKNPGFMLPRNHRLVNKLEQLNGDLRSMQLTIDGFIQLLNEQLEELENVLGSSEMLKCQLQEQ